MGINLQIEVNLRFDIRDSTFSIAMGEIEMLKMWVR
jgi:hypothetical protein